ncbi:MAG: peptidase [Pseudomonadota bacterium]
MTYCVGLKVRDGIVLIADTRTNAGLDNIAVFRKLHILNHPNQRVIALATAGNLAVSQAVISYLAEGVTLDGHDEPLTLETTPSMFVTAQLVGKAIREVYRQDGEALEQSGGFDVQMLLAGQIAGRSVRLYQVYSAGNFIEATTDTPYLQIGEHKYGKPILDRAVQYETSLEDALKLSLISMDSTMRSNLGVGMPIDTLVYRDGALEPEIELRITDEDPYFTSLRNSWSDALREAHLAIPAPPYWYGK